MKIKELLEHSNWEQDPYYTEDRVRALYLSIKAVQDYSSHIGIRLDIKDHFFDQMLAKRGMSKIEPGMLIDTFGRIINRGLHLFRSKPDGTNLVFYDPQTNLNIPFIKMGKNKFQLRTIMRDTRWLGPEPKVTLN